MYMFLIIIIMQKSIMFGFFGGDLQEIALFISIVYNTVTPSLKKNSKS